MIAWLTQWKLAAGAGLALAALAFFGLWRLEAGRVSQLESRAAQAQAESQMASAKASAAQDTAAIMGQGAARDANIQTVHAENSHVIDATPGANQGLDPVLNAAGRRSLCAYQAYAGSDDCVQLRGNDPGQRTAGDAADGSAAR